MHRALFVCLGVFSCCNYASAELFLSLSSPLGNPIALQLGGVATIQVELTGLETSNDLDHLGVSVEYPQALLGPVSTSLGDIVPNPLNDPTDINGLNDPGLAELSFLTFAASEDLLITENGTFFSFDVEAQALGQGSLEIVFADASKFNVSDPGTPISMNVGVGPSLPFVVVPEPSALCLTAFGVVVWMGCKRLF